MTKLSDLQNLVVEQLALPGEGRDLLVSAGAGSGKTFVLVESVLACLRSGIDLEKILVVTFTDKAASEMKNRIYDELEGDPQLAPLRLRLPNAWISTIHAFCARLLRERFERAGVDPRFRLLSPEDSRLMLEDAMSRVFHEGYRGAWGTKSTEAFEELVEMCGFDAGGEKLRGVVDRLLGYARTSEDPRGFLDGHAKRLRAAPKGWTDLPWAGDYAERTAEACSATIGLLRELVAGIEGLGLEPGRFGELLQLLESVDPASLATPQRQQQEMARLAAEGRFDAPSWASIRVPRLPRGAGKALGPLRKAVADALTSDWLSEIPVDESEALADERRASRLGLALVSLTRRVWKSYEEAKERTAQYDFEDLQIRALQLIEELAGTELAIHFERVFIDEFQDVNLLQHRILSKVGDPRGTFRVGDVKQSIYQFRLASPEIIRDLGSSRPLVTDPSAAPDGESAWNVLLPTNYRSLQPILTLVNKVAGGLFLCEEIGSDYGEQSLIRGGAVSPQQPPVEMLLVGGPEDEERNEEEETDAEEGPSDLQDPEWGAIAERIRELIETQAPVRDPETLELRPVRHSDIAILLRAKASIPALARRLEEEGIPCSLGADAPFLDAPEVRDLLQVLHAVDNLLDDIALAASLRSPAFGWKDAELLSLRLAYPQAIHLAFALASLADRREGGERFRAALLPEDAEQRADLCGKAEELPEELPFSRLPERAAEVLERFLRWREMAGRAELPELVTRIIRESGLLRSVASLPGGLRRQANLRKFLGITRRHVQETGHNLHRFLRWFDALAESRAPISEAPIASESVPAVRILTIHAAKGLEFPVVILAEMARRYRFGERSGALAPGRDYLGVRLLDVERYLLHQPMPLRLLLERKRADELAEEKRVLYVALTRARDRLILSGKRSRTGLPGPDLRHAYRSARAARDEPGRAAAQRLLALKASPLAWVFYAIPEIPAGGEMAEGDDDSLPLIVRSMQATRPELAVQTANRIAAIEPALRALEPVDLGGAEDPETARIVARSLRQRPLPSAGLLENARGKIWATEFKTLRDLESALDATSAGADVTDEPAVPLLRRSSGDAARVGTQIHELLEQLDVAGLAEENLEVRIAEAARRIGGVSVELAGTVGTGIARLLALPLGRALAASAEIHREVDFSLRIPLLEITRWLPELREEILRSSEWSGWIEPDGNGALRIRRGWPAEAGDPWVLVQGRIDLVFREKARWTVLDWKSDAVTEGTSIERRTALYRGQMEIYRRAAERLFGSPVLAALFYLRPGLIREI